MDIGNVLFQLHPLGVHLQKPGLCAEAPQPVRESQLPDPLPVWWDHHCHLEVHGQTLKPAAEGHFGCVAFHTEPFTKDLPRILGASSVCMYVYMYVCILFIGFRERGKGEREREKH